MIISPFELYPIMGPAFWPLLLCTFCAVYGSVRFVAASLGRSASMPMWKSFLNKIASASQAAGFYGTCYSMLNGLSGAGSGPGNDLATSLPALMGMAMGTTVWGLIIALTLFFVTVFTPLFTREACHE